MVYRPLIDAFRYVFSKPTLDEVRSLLDEAPEEDTRGQDLFAVIIHAIENGAESDVLQFLIERDTDCALLTDYSKQTLLHHACYFRSSHDVIWLLLKLNQNAASLPNADGDLPLHEALEDSEVSVMTVKLLFGFYPQALRTTNRIRHLPLHSACFNSEAHSSVDVFRFLIEQYPDGAHTVDSFGSLPLHLACRYHKESTEVIDLLIDAFLDGPSTQDNNGRVPLHIALCCRNWSAAGLLLTKNPNGAHERDSDGCLPIHDACEYGAPLDIIRLLIQANPESPGVQSSRGLLLSSRGRLPLHDACSFQRASLEAVQLLLEQHPHAIYVADRGGWLPLHLACDSSRPMLDHVRLLVQADPLTLLRKTPCGKTPVKLAFSKCSYMSAAKVYLLQEQENIMRAHHDAVAFVAGTRLDFTDLVVDKIWHFAKPDVWVPEDEEEAEEET